MPEQETKIKVSHTETFLIQISGQEIQVTRKDLEHLRVQINSAIGREISVVSDLEEMIARKRPTIEPQEIVNPIPRWPSPTWPSNPNPAWPTEPMKPYCHCQPPEIMKTQTETSDIKTP